MNKGTLEGDEYEIEFVKYFNSHKSSFLNYFNALGIIDYSKHQLVRVTTKQFSTLSKQRVMTRADAYLLKSTAVLYTNENHYISEDNLHGDEGYTKVPGSGISIKRADSSKYQILKLTPSSFFELFGEYELGAGASIYCDSKSDYSKNDQVLRGWCTDWNKFIAKFNTHTGITSSNKDQELVLQATKQYSNHKIKELIDSSKSIQKKVFNGIGLYEEPYTAHFFYNGSKIEALEVIPFTVTTGSGRSRGDYTIVLKPSN